jgi:hypothetical protein
MEHNNVAFIKGKNMIWCDSDKSATTAFNMPEIIILKDIYQPIRHGGVECL